MDSSSIGSIWPVSQVIKTPPFHGGSTGLNPVQVIWPICQAAKTPDSHSGDGSSTLP